MDMPSRTDLLDLAVAHLTEAGLEVTVEGDGLVTGDGRVFGLEPLRRRLAGLDRGAWREAVDLHFSALFAVDPSPPEVFEEAEPNLRSAVVAASDLGMFEGALVERPLAPGLGERLMLKRGDLAMTVTVDAASAWGVDPDEVWATARSNAIWDEPVTRRRVAVEGGRYLALEGGSWASTRVVDLGRELDPTVAYGALVAVPARRAVLVHQIRDPGFVTVAVEMLRAAVACHVRAPLPVTCDLYWWNAGRLERICAPDGRRFRYVRVPDFSAMLRRLEGETDFS